MSSTVARLRSAAKTMFGKYLIVTNIGMTTAMVTTGDLVTQMVIQKRKPANVDRDRLRRMFFLGIGSGFINHFWYTTLDKFIVGKSARIIAKKVFCDQGIFAPMFISFYFIAYTLLEGKSFNDGVTKLKKNFLPVYAADICVWPASQVVNFYFVPDRFRVAFVLALSFIWNGFLAYMQHRDQHLKELEDAAAETAKDREKKDL